MPRDAPRTSPRQTMSACRHVRRTMMPRLADAQDDAALATVNQ